VPAHGRAQGRGGALGLEHAGAIATFNACSAVLDKPDQDDKLRAEALKVRARAQFRLGDWNGAAREFDLAIALNPADPELHYRKSLLVFETHEFEHALRHTRDALALKADYAEAVDLAGVIVERLHGRRAALPFFERAIHIEPDEPNYHYHKMQMQAHLALHVDALREADLILAMPEEAIGVPGRVAYFGRFTSFETATRVERAHLLKLLGRFEEAGAMLNATIAEDPGPITYLARADFRSLRQFPTPAIDADLDRAIELDPAWWYSVTCRELSIPKPDVTPRPPLPMRSPRSCFPTMARPTGGEP
jgi:hypothetical protein